MKILKRILLILLVFLFLMTGLIVGSALNPELSHKVGDFLYRNGGVDSGEEALSILVDQNLQDELPDGSDTTGMEGESGQAQPGEAKEQGEEYISPQEEALLVPEEVAGKAGYQPVEGKEEQIDLETEEALKSQLSAGETGDGLVFDAQFYPYYHMLDEAGKHLYRQIYANAKGLNSNFKSVEAVSVAQTRNIFLAVYLDHPELFWLDTAYSGKYSSRGELVEVGLQFNQTAEDFENSKRVFEQSASDILSQVAGLSGNYEKERLVHDILIGKISYQLSSPMNQSAYSGIVSDQTVCAGYARAFQYLMQQLGIPCYYVTGYAGESHAWNIVWLEDGYYNVDLTWDDTPGGEYDYFNQSDQDFASTHIRQELSVYLPACNGQLYRNLEVSSGETGSGDQNAGQQVYRYRTLEETGLSGESVASSLGQYFDLCYQQITQNGKGSYVILNVLEGEPLMAEWYAMHQAEGYRQGYLERAMTDLGATSCQMQITIEELEGKKYLISQELVLD